MHYRRSAWLGLFGILAACSHGGDPLTDGDTDPEEEEEDGGSKPKTRPSSDGSDAGGRPSSAADDAALPLPASDASSSDASTCADGMACQPPGTECAAAPAGTACSTGACDGAGGCRAWGGAFETSDPGAPACHDANRLTTACSCGAGYAPISLRTLNESGGPHWGAIIHACSAPVPGDYQGVFEKDDNAPNNQGCRAKNPYTNDCTCPAGATTILLRTLVDVAGGGIIGSHIGVCAKPGGTTFGGAFEKDDGVPGGIGCRTPNPTTGVCSCPAGMSPQIARVQVDATGGFIGSTITFCGL